MKHILTLLLLAVFASGIFAETTEKQYHFDAPVIKNSGVYQQISLTGCISTSLPGNPALPYQSVVLALPVGHEAVGVNLVLENPVELPGEFQLFPYQHVRPLSDQSPAVFVKNEEVYAKNCFFPADAKGHLTTGFLNGYPIALTAFTPVVFNPVTGKIIYYKDAAIQIITKQTSKGVLAEANLLPMETLRKKVSNFVQNPEEIETSLFKGSLANPYKLLILTPSAFVGQFQPLKEMYDNQELTANIVSLEDVYASASGNDSQEKIRNFIISEYQNSGIEYVLLGGDAELFPYRGFYCEVQSSSLYVDEAIPSDLYYSALDGNWNTNGNNLWGEIGEDDLLPDVAVARLPFSNAGDLANMLNKTMMYQNSPVPGEFESPLLVDEKLYDNPETWGADYLDLLIGQQSENGYTTNGIPAAQSIDYLYERETGYWGPTELFAHINSGRQFVHHSGHSNWDYVMRLSVWDITNQNFSAVDGVQHNFTMVYTHGCICGAFDYADCIAEEMLKINNFCAAGAFNSRYGWFNEGQTEGPSAHMHREFVNALYTDGNNRIGATHQQSKIKTAPFVNAPGQWEQGALRWCFYDCNILGDPAMKIWTENITGLEKYADLPEFVDVSPNPASGFLQIKLSPGHTAQNVSLFNQAGLRVMQVSGSFQSMFSLDLIGIASGMYILEVSAGNEISHSKIIIR
jgi:hypothetical protein